jgi:TonB-dependent receptor
MQKRLFLSVAFIAIAHPAYAQQSAEEATAVSDDENVRYEIIVTGIRQSLDAGISVKRESLQIVDSIVAEDIGKLPDINVAESLQRVSGVQIKRSLGEGTQVSIRGLTQNLTLVNGRDVIDASGRGGSGLDSLNTGSYGLLAQLPSEIIQRLDVTKLSAASDIEGALSGTVNIITARPLAGKDDVYAFSVEGLYNDRADKFGVRASALLSHHFTDNFGALINLSYSKRNIRDESSFSLSGYQPLGAAFDTGATANTLGPGGTAISRNPDGTGAPGFYLADIRLTEIEDVRERFGVNATVQWEIDADSEMAFDLLYSRQNIDRDRNWFAANLSGNGNVYRSLTFSPSETVIAGTLNTNLQTNTESYENKGTTLAAGLNGKTKIDRFELSADIGYSRSKQDAIQHFLRLNSRIPYLVAFDFRNVDVPSFTPPAGLDLTNPLLFNFTNYFDNENINSSESKSARIDGIWEIDTSFLRSFKFGGRYSELDVSIDTLQSQLGGAVPAETVPDSYRIGLLNILNGASGYVPQPVLLPVLFGGGKELSCEVRGSRCTPYIFQPLSSYDTVEKTMAAYAQFDFDTDLGGVGVRGNAGIRYVHTNFRAIGSRTSASSTATILPVDVRKTSEDFLPSISVRADITDDLVIRAGFAEVLARPNSGDQNPGLTLTITPPFTASAGNAELEPFRGKQYDLSAEYYFAPSSILSVGLFKKDLKSFIVRAASNEVFDGVTYLVNRPRNGANASLKGFEVIFQNNFTFLPAPLDGLGVLVNYSYITSKTRDLNSRTGQPLPLTGLSKHNVNLVGYYEKGPIGLRVAYNWRDKFLDSIGSGGAGVFFDSVDDLSITARLKVTEAIGIDAQLSNALDSRVRKFGGVEDATALFGLNGRTFSLAIRGKF